MKKTKCFIVSLMIVLLIVFSACTKDIQENNPNENTESPKVGQGTKQEDTDQNILLKIFLQDGEEHFYHGYAEFGYALQYKDIIDQGNKKEIQYSGYMMDGEGDDPNDRAFTETYMIDEEQVVSKIEKAKKFGTYESLHLMDSIIENQIILKLPLEKGTVWEQEFTFKGQELVAKSEIIDIYDTNDGKKGYKIQYNVEDIEGFLDNVYTEMRIYEEGKGLVEFENKLPLSFYSSEEIDLDAESYKFAYSLVEE